MLSLLKASFFSKRFQGFFCDCNVLPSRVGLLCDVTRGTNVQLTMVKRCGAAECSNTYSDGVHLFKFPRDPAIRQQWVKQVQRTRAQWSGPSEHSILCSKHFTDSCFEPDSVLASKMGIKKCRRLKDDAIPTIFERPVSLPSCTPPSVSYSRKRAATTASSSDAPCQPEKKGELMRNKRDLG